MIGFITNPGSKDMKEIVSAIVDGCEYRGYSMDGEHPEVWMSKDGRVGPDFLCVKSWKLGKPVDSKTNDSVYELLWKEELALDKVLSEIYGGLNGKGFDFQHGDVDIIKQNIAEYVKDGVDIHTAVTQSIFEAVATDEFYKLVMHGGETE